MNEIKVTVTYEKPTTSKFDALMAEYEAAKKYADETVAYYKPLADAAEDAKFDAIMEQLETIKEYAKRISEITNDAVCIDIYIPMSVRNARDYSSRDGYFQVVYRLGNGFEISWCARPFTKEYMHKCPENMCQRGYNIIGMWDKWEVYQRLENEVYNIMNGCIRAQKAKADKQINRLNNIIKEEF